MLDASGHNWLHTLDLGFELILRVQKLFRNIHVWNIHVFRESILANRKSLSLLPNGSFPCWSILLYILEVSTPSTLSISKRNKLISSGWNHVIKDQGNYEISLFTITLNIDIRFSTFRFIMNVRRVNFVITSRAWIRSLCTHSNEFNRKNSNDVKYHLTNDGTFWSAQSLFISDHVHKVGPSDVWKSSIGLSARAQVYLFNSHKKPYCYEYLMDFIVLSRML